MANALKRTICPECGKTMSSLGFARHRAMHYDNRQKAAKNGREGENES